MHANYFLLLPLLAVVVGIAVLSRAEEQEQYTRLIPLIIISNVWTKWSEKSVAAQNFSCCWKMSDWETYTGGDGSSAVNKSNDEVDDWDPNGGGDSDDWNPDEGNSSNDDWNPDGDTNNAKDDWHPDGGNDSDEWNPDGGNGLNQDEMDDWNPDGGGAESRSENNSIPSPDNKQNDDNGGFWGDYFGDSESAAAIKNDDDANNESKGGNDEKLTSSSLFVKDEHDSSQWSESNHYQGVKDFYNEASKRKHPIAPSSPQSSHYNSEASVSQQSHTFSQHSNISAAELSRREEELLSQTSHREEEMKRQTVKEERRERRRRGGSNKRPRAQMSEEQKEYQAAYYRMKYRKKLELSDETDVGGSYAYLSRIQLEEENEQKRLKGLAWEREKLTRTEIHKSEDVDEAASSKHSKPSKAIKSKWSSDGYASLPHSQAKGLPFYIYTKKRPRSCSNSQLDDNCSETSLGSNEDSIVDVATDSKKNSTKNRPLIEDNGVQIEGVDIVSKYTPTNSRKRVQKSMVTGSFPLCHNRSKPKAGSCLGSEQMIFTQGKNAKRLWARMIASNGSYQCNATNDISNQLLQLTRQIHLFPSTSYRQQFISSMNNELGRNRNLWEENLREWVERNGFFSEEKQIAIKYLLGIDEDITSGTNDAIILSTYPTKFVSASRRVRQQLLGRFKKWVQRRKANPDFKSEGSVESDEDIFDPMAGNSDDEEAGFNVDDVNIVFNSKVDSLGTAATMSYFIDQLCLTKKRNDTLEQTRDTSNSCLLAEQGIQKWHKIISNYLSKVTVDSKLSVACFEKAGTPRYALPLFDAISAHQSYVANGSCLGLILRKENKDESDSDDEGDKPSHTQMSRDELKENELLQVNHAGNEIFKYTRSHINNENLAVFLPIRLTIGISVLTEFLPPDATEILSRQTYSETNTNKTPFDLLRLVLEQLEERSTLVSSGSFLRDKSERPIVDESLTDAMQVAAEIFQQCKDIEPTNVQYWSWYIATLFARLCVASGTSLSAKTEMRRKQLHCFDGARKDASCAVDEFIQRAKSEDCPMFFFGVTSMLEWRRAIIFLHRHALFSTVNRLHAYTSYRWAASKFCSDLSLARVQSLYAKQKIPLDALLDVLAGLVEQNACDVSKWGMLVTALGGVGTPMKTNGECSEGCNALHDGLFVNHAIEQDKRNGVWWWGQSRRSDWETNFFISPRNDPDITSCDCIRMDLDGKFSAEWEGYDQRQIVNSKILHQETILPDDIQDCMDWLFDEEEGDNDIDIDLSYEHLLPYHHTPDTHISEDQLDSLSKITNKPMKVLCLKIIVACHMLGVWHPFVSNSISWLLVKTRASNKSASESLRWLAIRGLNIQSYIQQRDMQN